MSNYLKTCTVTFGYVNKLFMPMISTQTSTFCGFGLDDKKLDRSVPPVSLYFVHLRKFPKSFPNLTVPLRKQKALIPPRDTV